MIGHVGIALSYPLLTSGQTHILDNKGIFTSGLQMKTLRPKDPENGKLVRRITATHVLRTSSHIVGAD